LRQPRQVEAMTTEVSLSAARRLTLHFDGTSHLRLAWDEPDWLGPIGFMLAATPALAATLPPRLEPFGGSDDLGAYHGLGVAWDGLAVPLRMEVRAYADVPLLVFRLEALDRLGQLTTGSFEQPSVSWPAFQPRERMTGGVPAGTRSYGHQYCEFALPVSGDANCGGFFLTPHRPAVVAPLLFIAPDGRTLLLAPLDQFHEQVIAVPRDGTGVRCGWHGDLREVPAGFATEVAIWAGDGPRALLDAWAQLLCRRHGTQRPSRYADDLLGKLSYWTDNGSVYYYRTEAGCDYTTTLERVVGDLHARDIPVRSVQIDSWFYPHRHLRPVSAEGATLVPPTGMMTWEPRGDLFPDGISGLRQVHGLPLTLHSRHFSNRSAYFERHPAWRDDEFAHPQDGELYDLLMAQAASWGAITYEQDWMVESFLGVSGLREQPGRARLAAATRPRRR